MAHRSRPLYLPHRQPTYVAVRPFKWKGVTLGPGDELPSWPTHHMRHLHAQGMIGPKGYEWTEQRIANWARRIAKGIERSGTIRERAIARLEGEAEEADLVATEAMETAEEARSLRDRVNSLFGGGESDARSAGAGDPS